MDPESIVRDIGVRKPSHDLRHAAGTWATPWPTLGSGSGVRRWGRSRPGCSPWCCWGGGKNRRRFSINPRGSLSANSHSVFGCAHGPRSASPHDRFDLRSGTPL